MNKLIGICLAALFAVGCATGYKYPAPPEKCAIVDHKDINDIAEGKNAEMGDWAEVGREYDDMCNIIVFYQNKLTGECVAVIGVPVRDQSGKIIYAPYNVLPCDVAYQMVQEVKGAKQPEGEKLNVDN